MLPVFYHERDCCFKFDGRCVATALKCSVRILACTKLFMSCTFIHSIVLVLIITVALSQYCVTRGSLVNHEVHITRIRVAVELWCELVAMLPRTYMLEQDACIGGMICVYTAN